MKNESGLDPVRRNSDEYGVPVDWDSKPSAAWVAHRSLVESAILRARLDGRYAEAETAPSSDVGLVGRQTRHSEKGK